jgi:hypothetical protein
VPNSYTFSNWIAAWVTWIATAFAVQWYLYLSQWGIDGWPLPGIECAAGMFAIELGPDAATKSLTWWGWTLFWIPMAGTIWTSALYITAPFFGGSAEKFRTIISSFAAGYAPLALMGVILTGVAWRLEWGYWWDRGPLTIAPPLRVWPWLGWVFLGAAAIAPVVQLRVYSLRFGVRGLKMIYHITLCLIVTMIATAGTAAIAAYFFDQSLAEQYLSF